MAVLKHIAIKNADYSAAVCYLKYQHDERHLKPLLDENGSMMLRSEFHMNGVNCNPDTFDLECEMLNDQYRKNYRYDEVKSHHYIISYAQKVKISNLQQMAKTVAYIQENGFDTRENLQTTYDSITLQMHDARQKTKDTETQIKSVNEQIHYLGQYLSTKSTYNEFLKARFKGKFRKDHADEIEKHEKAVQILKAQNPDDSLPKMKDLKLEKERLLALKAAQYDTYTYYKDYQKELRTACANVDSILGQHHIRDHIQRTEQTL